MTYEQWSQEHNSDSQLLRDCWEKAQADVKDKLVQKLGEDNGYAGRKFYPRLADVVKEIT
jgi:hypothetical protein